MAYGTPEFQHGTDLGIWTDWLKEWYLQNWIDLLSGGTATWQLFRQDAVEYHGNQMVIPLRYRRNSSPQPIARSTTAGAASSTLSIPGHMGVTKATATPRLLTGAIELPQDAIDQAQTDRGTFYDILDGEMMNLLRDFKERLDAQCYGDGSGLLPFYQQYTGTTVVPSVLATNYVKYPVTPGTPLFPADNWMRVSNGHYYYEGMRIRVWASDYAAERAPFDNASTEYNELFMHVKRIEFDDNGVSAKIELCGEDSESATSYEFIATEAAANDITIGASDKVHWYGYHNYAGAAHTQYGFRGLSASMANVNPLGESDYLGINRSSYSYFNSIVDKTLGSSNIYDWTSSTAGNPALCIQKNIDTVHNRSFGEIDLILMSRDGTRQYAALAQGLTPQYSKQRFMNTISTKTGFMDKNQDKHPGGQNWMLFNEEIPIVVDKYAGPWVKDASATSDPIYQPIWMLDSSTHYVGLVSDFSWWDTGAGIFRPAIDSSIGRYKYAVTADVTMLADHICDSPNRNALLTGVKIGTCGTVDAGDA